MQPVSLWRGAHGLAAARSRPEPQGCPGRGRRPARGASVMSRERSPPIGPPLCREARPLGGSQGMLGRASQPPRHMRAASVASCRSSPCAPQHRPSSMGCALVLHALASSALGRCWPPWPWGPRAGVLQPQRRRDALCRDAQPAHCADRHCPFCPLWNTHFLVALLLVLELVYGDSRVPPASACYNRHASRSACPASAVASTVESAGSASPCDPNPPSGAAWLPALQRRLAVSAAKNESLDCTAAFVFYNGVLHFRGALPSWPSRSRADVSSMQDTIQRRCASHQAQLCLTLSAVAPHTQHSCTSPRAQLCLTPSAQLRSYSSEQAAL